MIPFLRTGQGIIAIVAAASIAIWAWVSAIGSKAVNEYQSRVEIRGNKIDAKAQSARKRAATDADRVLERYYRDR